MKELECSQDFSHNKSMGIFLDAQGQLTPQPLVRSGQISNSVETLWLSYLPAKMKKIRSINRGARVFTTLYKKKFRCARADNSAVLGPILPNFELVRDVMNVLVTCKYEEDPIKNEELECLQNFSHYKSMGIFPDAQGQLTPQSLVRSGRISNSSEML